jgi:hypothetical protein
VPRPIREAGLPLATEPDGTEAAAAVAAAAQVDALVAQAIAQQVSLGFKGSRVLLGFRVLGFRVQGLRF